MGILLLNHSRTRPAGPVWLSHSTAIYLTSRPSVFSFMQEWKWVSHLPGPFKPGSGPPAQSRVWRPCRWQVLQSLSGTEEQPVQLTWPAEEALPCHADCSCLSLQDRQLTSRRPPVLTAVWRRCAIQHPSPFQRSCLIPWTGHWVSTQARFQTLWRIQVTTTV